MAEVDSMQWDKIRIPETVTSVQEMIDFLKAEHKLTLKAWLMKSAAGKGWVMTGVVYSDGFQVSSFTHKLKSLMLHSSPPQTLRRARCACACC